MEGQTDAAPRARRRPAHPARRRLPAAGFRGAVITEIRVELVGRDALGSIVTLITSRGAIDAQTAAAEIESGRTQYVAGPDSFVRARVRAIPSVAGLYLYANWDGTRRNNLHQLSPARLTRPGVTRPTGRGWIRETFAAAARTFLRTEPPHGPEAPPPLKRTRLL